MEKKRLTIGKVAKITRVRPSKINRCVDSGLIEFTRNKSSDFRLFDENAVRILKVYHAVNLLKLRLSHNEICRAITLLTVSRLEEAKKKGPNTLMKLITDHLGDIRT